MPPLISEFTADQKVAGDFGFRCIDGDFRGFDGDIRLTFNSDMLNTAPDSQRVCVPVVAEFSPISIHGAPDIFVTEWRFIHTE